MSSTLSKMIVLKSSDGVTFELDETVALASQTIKHMIEDGCADSVIPVPNITSKILKKVIEYCNKHAETPMDKNKVSEEDLNKVSVEDLKVSVEDLKVTEEDPKVTEEAPKVSVDDLKVSEEDLKAFDAEFVQVDQDTLFAIILAANYLNIKSLLELTCKTVADMARGKTVQEIRDHFNIKNDLTPEEEEQIALENAWAFDHDDKSDVTTPAEDEQTQEEQA